MMHRLYTNKRFIMLIAILVVFVLNAVVVDIVIYSSTTEIDEEEKEQDFDSPEPDKTETEKEKDPDKDPEKDPEDEKEPSDGPFSKSDESDLLDKIEILSIVIDGKEKGQIDKSELGIKIQPGKDYGVLRVDGEIETVSIGETVIKGWELTAIKPDYIVLKKAGEEIELGLYK